MLSLIARGLVAAGLLWTVTFTAPLRNSTSHGGSFALGAPDSSAAADTCRDAARFESWRHRQSPTWVARHAAMQAADTTWSRLWPAVRSEAAYQLVGTWPTTPLDAGKTVALSLPDTLSLGWFYVFVTVDSSGNRSGVLKELWR